MGTDNHPTTVPKDCKQHTVEDARDVLVVSEAFSNVVPSSHPDADVYATLNPDYDTKKHLPEWLAIENVYATESTTGLWFVIDE